MITSRSHQIKICRRWKAHAPRTGDENKIDCGNAGRGDRCADLAVLMAEIDVTHGPEAAARIAQEI
jgi:hypothetical protein